MSKAALFMITGFEEIEAIATLDILRRGQVPVDLVSLTDTKSVTGSHGITVTADTSFEAARKDYELLILPGGPGTERYFTHTAFLQYLTEHIQSGKPVAAICAAPTVLGHLGFLADKTSVCYPGLESRLHCKTVGTQDVVTDGGVTTSRGPGTVFAFGLSLLSLLKGQDAADTVRKAMLLSMSSI